MKVAYFSPMPPEASGIADYSALLLPALRRHVDVTVVKRGTKRPPRGVDLAVYHIGEALIDPDNGQVLGYRESNVGVIKIASHQNENLSSATIVSGSGFRVGDVAKPVP